MHKGLFDTVKPLGIGAFGVVSLVRKTDTGKLYAMKTLRKVDVLRKKPSSSRESRKRHSS